MVRGLFSRKEAEPVLALLEQSVVFLTREHIQPQIQEATLDTAWEIANMYLRSIGAKRLDPKARHIVGFSEETTCYVSLEYFSILTEAVTRRNGWKAILEDCSVRRS